MGFLSIAAAFFTLAGSAVCDAPHVARAVNASADQFHHRGFHNSVVVGNTLYIDGGEVTTWDGTGNGVQTSQPQVDGNIDTQPVNFTYSVDLSSSWTNSSITINTIRPKAAPVVNNEALWLSADNKTIYAYNGGISSAPPHWYDYPVTPPNYLWQFNPDAGRWHQAYISPSTIWSTLVRVTGSINAYGNGLGFALGGSQSLSTSASLFSDTSERTYVPNMIVYNISSQEWYNVSSTGYTSTGYTVNGAAQFVPSFGPNGLLFVFGGQYGDPVSLQYAQFDYAWMYEPISKAWTSQKVTGEIPAVRTNPCVVGAQGDNGTYEIFLFGGTYGGDVGKTVNNGAVHVLSLPSFNWQKVSDAQYGRFEHSCNVGGNRQMISVGGVVFDRSTSSDAFLVAGGRADPWDNGFGVFDMVDLEWKSTFDPSADVYVTSDVVKSKIEQNGFYPSDWTDSTVERWFTHPGSASSSGDSSDGGSTKGGSSTNVGAIAGGVVGGVLGLALIAALIFFYLRWRRRRMGRNNPTYQPPANAKYRPVDQPFGASPAHDPGELDGANPAMELPVRDKPAQPAPGQVHELESGAGWPRR